MFDKKDEEFLLRRLARNEVVLFLGSGFSMMAKNNLDENLPSGKVFAKKIWQFLGLSGDYENFNTPLPAMYQALLNSGTSFPEIEELLCDNLLIKSFPNIYFNLTIPYWFKIYTVNVDDLVEKIYWNSNNTNLQILKYPRDEFRERDQTLDYLQAVYLHGKLRCRPNEVIFSRTQYASSTLHLQPLYFQFIQDYSTLPTVFIGTALDEPLFEQYIAARKARRTNLTENRPKSFLIDPFINPIQESLYRSYNIEPITATTEDFLKWLFSIKDKLPNKLDTLKIVLPSLSQLISLGSFKETYRDNINDFAQSFSKINLNKTFQKTSKAFLLGTTPTWGDIYQNLDAHRNIFDTIFKQIESGFDNQNDLSCTAILGSAGSGKSTLLKRISYELAKNGRSVYFSPSETMPSADNLYRTLEMLNEKVVLAVDNAELTLAQITSMIDGLKLLKFPPIWIIAARTNIYDRVIGRTQPLHEVKEFEMPNLDRSEIIGIIRILQENNLLGYLKGLSESQRIKEFENRARKQILIAMREATHGEDFDVIIKSEYDQISPDEAKALCVCVALATDAGFTISKQDFVSFSSEPPATTLDYLERTLKDIILKVGPKNDKLLLRHRVIAGFIIENCVTTEVLKQAYINILSSLANEIKNSNRNPRKFILYREIINHSTIYKRFSKDISQARLVYESLASIFNDDFQFWLQYGSLESEGIGGNLQLAENYLNQALSLKPTNIYVRNAIANLYYKKAIETNIKVVAIEFKDAADAILSDLMNDRFSKDPYTYAIYAKGNYEYALKWAFGEKETLKSYFNHIHKVTKLATNLYPNDKKLKKLNETIFKAILMTNVEEDNIQYPMIFSEVDL